MPQVIEVPGQGQVEFPDGMTDDQIVAAIKKLSAPSIGDRAARVAGLGARALVTGATAVPTLMAEAAAYPLRALTGGKYFPSPSATLQQGLTSLGLPEPANAAERISTDVTSAMAGGGTTQLAARAAQPVSQVGQGVKDVLLQQPGRQTVAAGTGGAASSVAGEMGAGPTGQTVAGMVGGALPFAGQAVRQPSPEQLQTAQTAAVGREAGYVLPPSQVNPSITNKVLGGFGGQIKTEQAAALKNQTVTNRLVRQELNLPQDAPLNAATLEAARTRASLPYREVQALIPNGRQALDDLQTARLNANDAWRSYDRDPAPARRMEAIQYSRQAEALEGQIEAAARSAGRPELVDQLRAARQYIAKTYDVERALNVDTGNVDARIIAKSRDRGAPLTGNLRTVGQFSNAFDRATQSMDGKTPPGVSVWDYGMGLSPLAIAQATQSPGVAALAALPLLRPAVRSLVLSEPYQSMMANPQTSVLSRPNAAGLGILSGAYSW